MAEFGVAESELVTVFLHAIFYGLFLATFLACCKTLYDSGGRAFSRKYRVRTLIVCLMVLMAILQTVSPILDLWQVLYRFIWRDGRIEFANWSNIVKAATFATETMIGDGLLLYRCYVVWTGSRRWMVMFIPTLIYCSVCGAYWGAFAAFATTNPDSVSAHSLNIWISLAAFTTFFLNVILTVLISFRIWTVVRSSTKSEMTQASGGTDLKAIMRIIIESGLMYTATAIVFLATSLAKNNAVSPVSAVVEAIVGINFNLILILVNQAKNQCQCSPYQLGDSTAISFAPRSRTGTGGSVALDVRSTSSPDPHAVQISVTEDTTRHSDADEELERSFRRHSDLIKPKPWERDHK